MPRRLLLALALVVLPSVDAHAAPASHAKPAKPAHASHSSRWHRADNMPRGFVWPPSPTMTAAAAACDAQLDALAIPRASAKAEGHMVDAIAVTPDATDAHRFELGGITYVGVFGKGPYSMDCQLVAALATFGADLHDLGVREIHFGSIYRWSKVRVGGKTKDMLSRHALGLAMDVVSIVDADGHEAVVATDYLARRGKAPKDGDPLLHAVEQAVNHSGHFRMVLTPANDPISHHDHFHIEADVDYTKPTS